MNKVETMTEHHFFGELKEETYKDINFAGTNLEVFLYNAHAFDATLLNKLASFCENSVEIDKKACHALALALNSSFFSNLLHNVEDVESDVLADFMDRSVENGEKILPREFAQSLGLKAINSHQPSPVLNEEHGTDPIEEFDVKNSHSVMLLTYDLDGMMREGGLLVYFNIDGEVIKVY